MSIISGFAVGFGYGLLALVIAVIVAFIGVIFARIYMEVIMVFFRIKDLLEQMAQAKGVAPPAHARPGERGRLPCPAPSPWSKDLGFRAAKAMVERYCAYHRRRGA